MSKSTLRVTTDFTNQFNRIIGQFKSDAVLVGVPESDTERKSDSKSKQEINNATLLAINNYGSPANNIPARPVMQIGIKNVQDQVAALFAKTATEALTKGEAALDTGYNRIGIVASSSIKKVINSQEGIEAPSQSTLKSRERAGFSGNKALIVTGQLRNSITYVVNNDGRNT